MDRYNPVLQHYQVKVVGNKYYVIDSYNRAYIAGPYDNRTSAQETADSYEQRSWRR